MGEAAVPQPEPVEQPAEQPQHMNQEIIIEGGLMLFIGILGCLRLACLLLVCSLSAPFVR